MKLSGVFGVAAVLGTSLLALARPIGDPPAECFSMNPVDVYYQDGTCWNCGPVGYEITSGNSGFDYIYTTGYAQVECQQGTTRVHPNGHKWCDMSSSTTVTRTIPLYFGGPWCSM